MGPEWGGIEVNDSVVPQLCTLHLLSHPQMLSFPLVTEQKALQVKKEQFEQCMSVAELPDGQGDGGFIRSRNIVLRTTRRPTSLTVSWTNAGPQRQRPSVADNTAGRNSTRFGKASTCLLPCGKDKQTRRYTLSSLRVSQGSSLAPFLPLGNFRAGQGPHLFAAVACLVGGNMRELLLDH
ncbi:hypothetical protein BR93DRAFT_722506 [Coniochaeta sp. PMI_546]|nr:hypothetical protein BR93DRAFT_722506 [Coniochaeta sp. PMI_546]